MGTILSNSEFVLALETYMISIIFQWYKCGKRNVWIYFPDCETQISHCMLAIQNNLMSSFEIHSSPSLKVSWNHTESFYKSWQKKKKQQKKVSSLEGIITWQSCHQTNKNYRGFNWVFIRLLSQSVDLLRAHQTHLPVTELWEAWKWIIAIIVGD